LHSKTLYLDQFREKVKSISDWLNYHSFEPVDIIETCLFWAFMVAKVKANLGNLTGPNEALQHFEVLPDFDTPEGQEIRPCWHCYHDMSTWRAQADKVLKSMNPLHSFLAV
jgi:hypothetical protein